jgi:hypothetical protein
MRDALLMTRRLAALVLCGLVVGAVRAEEVSPGDAKALRAVIEAQLAAFKADDAPRAFSYASPAIRELYGNAATFMAMVRKSYPVVHRPKTVSFLAPQRIDGAFIQRVRMTDATDRGWLAVYQMERQPDGSWRIAGCQVVPSEARVT